MDDYHSSEPTFYLSIHLSILLAACLGRYMISPMLYSHQPEPHSRMEVQAGWKRREEEDAGSLWRTARIAMLWLAG